MDDDNSDWLSEAVEEEPAPVQEEAPAPAAVAATADVKEETSKKDGEFDLPPELPYRKRKPLPEPEKSNNPHVLPDIIRPYYFKHWLRPKFLNYRRLHDYWKIYYDDCIDYLDKRQRGLIRDVPRAQEWGERAFRLYTSGKQPGFFTECDKIRDKDIELLSKMNSSAKFYRHHSNAFVHMKYAHYLYAYAY